MNLHSLLGGARARAMWSFLACFLLAYVPFAHSDEKKYGYDDPDTGVGVAFSDKEAQKIRNALEKLRGIDIKPKTGRQVHGDSIANDLGGMLQDGRMGKGAGARRNVNGSTRRDGKDSTKGDRINISDHFIHKGWVSNRSLASVLAHEWAHAKQTDAMKRPQREAEAYQIEQLIYREKGGLAGDEHDLAIETKIQDMKDELEGNQQLLPDSDTPAKGAAMERGSFDNDYILLGHPSELVIWWNDMAMVSLVPLPEHTFLTLHVIPRPGLADLVLVFGCDTSIVGDPQGVITAVAADSEAFADRTEIPIAPLRHPFGVTLDSATGTWYVLDTHHAGAGISRMLDTDADDVPDVVEPVPFASRAFPGVAGAQFVGFAEHPDLGGGLMLYDFDARGADDTGTPEPVEFLVDQTGNGVADQLYMVPEIEFVTFAPAFAEVPCSGEIQLEVVGMPGHTIEVWAADSSGDSQTELLGSVVAEMVPTTVSLGRALVFAEYVLPLDATAGTRPVISTQVEAAGVPGVAPSGLATLVLLLAAAGAWELARRRARAG